MNISEVFQLFFERYGLLSLFPSVDLIYYFGDFLVSFTHDLVCYNFLFQIFFDTFFSSSIHFSAAHNWIEAVDETWNKKVFVSLGTRNAIISLRLIGWTQHEKKNGKWSERERGREWRRRERRRSRKTRLSKRRRKEQQEGEEEEQQGGRKEEKGEDEKEQNGQQQQQQQQQQEEQEEEG